jgi:hypothetical protein
LLALLAQLGKHRHQRRYLRSEHKPDRTPKAGHVSQPTFYLENPRSGVKIKSYMRHRKLPGGGYGGLVVRLEWTLTGRPALIRHLRGNQISHLLAADLNDFLRRNIRLERPDHAALGNLFRGIKITAPRSEDAKTSLRERWKDPGYWAERAAFMILRRLAYREHVQRRFTDDFAQALFACQNSPAHIRGYCRELRDGDRPPRRGHPREHQPRPMRRPITDHRINQCFYKIDLIEVPPARIIIHTSPKSDN